MPLSGPWLLALPALGKAPWTLQDRRHFLSAGHARKLPTSSLCLFLPSSSSSQHWEGVLEAFFSAPPPRGGHYLPGMLGGRGRELCYGERNVFTEMALPACLPPAVQDSVSLVPAQLLLTTTLPSFILFPRWLAGLLPVTSLLSSSRSSHFHSVQDSLTGGIGSLTPRWRLLFPSSVSSAVS